jgi:hypothetical protein
MGRCRRLVPRRCISFPYYSGSHHAERGLCWCKRWIWEFDAHNTRGRYAREEFDVTNVDADCSN